MSEILQADEWLYLRLGRFTASENWKLFTGGRRDMTPEELITEKLSGGKRKTVDTLFGEVAIGYIMTKAAERLTMQVKTESNFIQTNWGKENEWDANEMYQEETGIKGEYYGTFNPKFFEYGEYQGCSPDFISSCGKKGADFKNPYDSTVHLSNLRLKDQDDFKEKRWEYFVQAQTIIYQRKLDSFDYVSFDKRYIEPRLRLKILTITPDLDWQAEYEVRLAAAIEELNNIISQLN
jgi:hypothetical protein